MYHKVFKQYLNKNTFELLPITFMKLQLSDYIIALFWILEKTAHFILWNLFLNIFGPILVSWSVQIVHLKSWDSFTSFCFCFCFNHFSFAAPFIPPWILKLNFLIRPISISKMGYHQNLVILEDFKCKLRSVKYWWN